MNTTSLSKSNGLLADNCKFLSHPSVLHSKVIQILKSLAGIIAAGAILSGLEIQSAENTGFRLPIFGKAVDTAALKSLSQDEVLQGLKQALAIGFQRAITNLGTTNAFLGDAAVKITVPKNLQKVEQGLRAAGQGEHVDKFVETMNHAAEQAVPQAAGVLGQSLKEMPMADAKAILTGSSTTAATDYFKRSTSSNLFGLFLPMVKKATDQNGVASAYKTMMEKVTPGGFKLLGALGNLGVTKETVDVDTYVTNKALDGLFLKMAEQEKLFRENPAARQTELLQKVFGVLKK
jgi:hypothetical protein